jgi:hypothetical protein
MKTRHLTTIIVASSLMLPITALGQSSTAERDRNAPAATSQATTGTPATGSTQTTTGARATTGSQSVSGERATTGSANWNERSAQHSSSMKSTSVHGIKKVDKDKLDSKLTAKELIGKEVADMNGERLGRVHDIGLAQALPSEFRAMEEADTSRRDTSREFSTTAGSALSSAGSAMSAAAGMNNVNLYVAVGGIMGLGSDIVSVPADQFSYDRENDRLTLNISEDRFTAIAEGEDSDSVTFRSTEGYASGAGTTGTTGIGATDSSFGTTGTGLSATTDRNEVQKIQQALRNDSDLRNVASRINISESGNDILLTGEVTSEDQKDKVVEFVRDQTDKNVRDNLRVSSAAE